jgi:hypothetical protein
MQSPLIESNNTQLLDLYSSDSQRDDGWVHLPSMRRTSESEGSEIGDFSIPQIITALLLQAYCFCKNQT